MAPSFLLSLGQLLLQALSVGVDTQTSEGKTLTKEPKTKLVNTPREPTTSAFTVMLFSSIPLLPVARGVPI
jgi:hypothetical protein